MLLHPSIRHLYKEFRISKGFAQRNLTNGKYRSMALRKRCLYCRGPMIVGSPLCAPPRKVESLTQLSSFLSQVYVRM